MTDRRNSFRRWLQRLATIVRGAGLVLSSRWRVDERSAYPYLLPT